MLRFRITFLFTVLWLLCTLLPTQTFGSDSQATRDARLLTAVKHNDLAQAGQLLAEGANVNVQVYPDLTPLIIACDQHDVRMAELLLHYHPNVNALGGAVEQDYTALMSAARSGNLALVKLLLAHGADVNLGNNDCVTALMMTSKPEIARLLIHHGADVNAFTCGSYSGSALRLAVCDENIRMVRLLLKSGADVHSKDSFGVTALQSALTPEIARLLIRHGADVNINNNQGESLLSVLSNAVDYGDLRMVRFWLSLGANVFLRDEYGRTPLDYARKDHKHKASILRLLQRAITQAKWRETLH